VKPELTAPATILRARDVAVSFTVYEDRARPTLKTAMADSVRRRRRRRTVAALRGIGLEAHRGEAIGLIGGNGSGKTTLLRALAGLVPLRSGSVEAASRPVLLGIGAALQPELSGRRNVFLGGTALGLSGRAVAERFDDIVEFAQLEDFIDVPLRAYSAGMAARLRFAIASASAPEILLIDELLGVGDAEFRVRSEQRLRELLDEAGTVFLVSHNLRSIADTCSRVVWLHQGEIVQDGPVDEVLAAYGQGPSRSL
jgi:teichoic acid transport system ATP-binding protein